MKRLNNLYIMMAAMMMACVDKDTRSAFINKLPPSKPKRKPIDPMTPERERAIMEAIEKNKHDFNIHGTIIRAKDRKTAIKIYNNRNNK